MKKDNKRNWFCWISMGFFSLMCLTVHAHLLSSNFVMNKMVKDRSPLKNIELDGIVTEIKTQQRFQMTTKIDFLSGRVLAVFYDGGHQKIFQKNMKLGALHPLGLAWFGVGFCSNPNKVKVFLDQLGVSLPENAEVKLKRIDSRPVWEIGESPTLKIEKDQFILSAFEFDHQTGYEVEKWSQMGATVHIPKTMHFKKDSEKRFTYELTASRVNQPGFEISTARADEEANSLNPLLQEWVSLVY